jgi:type II secretion system protein N
MKREMTLRGGKLAIIAAYVGGALIVGLATAIAFFPYQALEARMENSLRKRAGVNLRLAGTGYSPPFGLSAEKAILSRASRGPSLELTEIGMQWRPWALLWGEQRFSGEARACGGRIGAVCRFGSLFLRDGGAGSLKVKDVSLQRCANLLQSSPVSGLSGVLEGEARVRNLREGLRGLSGNASMRIDGARIGFERGPLGGLAVEEARFRGSFHKKGGTFRVVEARLDAPGIEASLRGRVRLAGQLEKSELDLQTRLEFHPGRLARQPDNAMIRQAMAREALELSLQGTAAGPRIRSR